MLDAKWIILVIGIGVFATWQTASNAETWSEQEVCEELTPDDGHAFALCIHYGAREAVSPFRE